MHSVSAKDPERPRFLNEAECHDILQRLVSFAKGGGYTAVGIASGWTGNIRWARNQVSTSGEVEENTFSIVRRINGASALVTINEHSDVAFVGALRRAERLLRLSREAFTGDLPGEPIDPSVSPNIYSEETYQLNADRRAEAARSLSQSSVDAGMLSAGYIGVSAHSRAVIDSDGGSRYFKWTFAQYSVTVRDPKGTGSGWAGIDSDDWMRIDGEVLSKVAMEKCLASRNPVRVEPGRYTAILEPQAVCDLTEGLLFALQREPNESDDPSFPFWRSPKVAMLGDKVIDERISISTDPMDPELGYPPWSAELSPWRVFNDAIHPTTWIDHGILRNLSYGRDYAISQLGRNTGIGSWSFRMSGGTTTVEEMIATTKRGLLVTRLDRVQLMDSRSQLYKGYTRDGLWLIENGKISKACKNLLFSESPLFALNNIEQLGIPKRVFRPPAPMSGTLVGPLGIIVPALKVQDFNFVALSDAV